MAVIRQEGGNPLQKLNDEADNLRKTIEKLSDQIIRNKAHEEKVLSEFSAMNNELITLQRQLAKSNAELEQARAAAAQANEAKSTLLAMIGHEIRTPMSGILGLTELMAGPGLSKEHRESVGVIHNSAAMLLNMINDLLDLSKIEAGKMVLKSEPLRIRSVIDHISKLMDSKIKDNGNLLLLQIDEKIQDHLIGDAGRLTQIVLNLLSNANKFTSYGHLNLRVQMLEESTHDQLLRFEMQDNGIGISVEDQERLFQPYIQTYEGSSPHYGGTGLGLSICKSFVELMGGRIGVNSTQGAGSSFWFEVRLQKGDPVVTGMPLEQPKGAVDGDDGTLNGLSLQLTASVLVAEDNPINRQVIIMQLRRLGIQHIDSANNGEEAFRAAEKKKYSLIFMDSMMPKLNGLEAARKIRDFENEMALLRVPIIALTGNTDERDREQCLDAGMDDYLPKPVSLHSLSRMLHQWLPANDQLNILDHTVIGDIQDLNEGGDTDLLAELFQMYTEETPRKIDHLRQQMVSGNLIGIAAAAHDMKSSSLSLGIVKFSELLSRIEKAAKEDRISCCLDTLELLLPAYYEACRELKQYLK